MRRIVKILASYGIVNCPKIIIKRQPNQQNYANDLFFNKRSNLMLEVGGGTLEVGFPDREDF